MLNLATDLIFVFREANGCWLVSGFVFSVRMHV